MTNPLILITNDDGISSPGLAAAAAAMDGLGELLIVAPLHQQTSMGRSRTLLPLQNGEIQKTTINYRNKNWPAYSVNATPALVVDVAIQYIAQSPVLFSVSGINYGENIGTCITVSGTIGAAMEAAERGIRSIAISLETPASHYHEHDAETDFSTALHFTRLFASKLINKDWPPDIDVFKIEIPASATIDSPWVLTFQDRISYYNPEIFLHNPDTDPEIQISHSPSKGKFSKEGSDAHALAEGKISITPLSLDHTSRIHFPSVQKIIDSI